MADIQPTLHKAYTLRLADFVQQLQALPRYDVQGDIYHGGGYVDVQRDADGDWLKAEDLQKVMAAFALTTWAPPLLIEK